MSGISAGGSCEVATARCAMKLQLHPVNREIPNQPWAQEEIKRLKLLHGEARLAGTWAVIEKVAAAGDRDAEISWLFQLMRFAWKFMVPLALLNLANAAGWALTAGWTGPFQVLRWVVGLGVVVIPFVVLGRTLSRGSAPRVYRYA